jgi:hypothetical protein
VSGGSVKGYATTIDFLAMCKNKEVICLIDSMLKKGVPVSTKLILFCFRDYVRKQIFFAQVSYSGSTAFRE